MIRIAVITGAGYSRAGGWPDASAILDHGAWVVTADTRYQAVWDAYATWKARTPVPVVEVPLVMVAGVVLCPRLLSRYRRSGDDKPPQERR